MFHFICNPFSWIDSFVRRSENCLQLTCVSDYWWGFPGFVVQSKAWRVWPEFWYSCGQIGQFSIACYWGNLKNYFLNFLFKKIIFFHNFKWINQFAKEKAKYLEGKLNFYFFKILFEKNFKYYLLLILRLLSNERWRPDWRRSQQKICL